MLAKCFNERKQEVVEILREDSSRARIVARNTLEQAKEKLNLLK
ncbi:MAG: hypothetical protein AABW65_02070 [Nanoarchaeota archaeon]